MENMTKNIISAGTDVTTLTEKEAIAYFTGDKVQGIGSLEAAFFYPTLSVDGVGSEKGKKIIKRLKTAVKKTNSVIKKAAVAVKNSFKKLVNHVFKQLLPLAAPFFLFTFLKNPKGIIGKAAAKQKKMIQWLAGKMGTSEAVVVAAITRGIYKKYGMAPEKVIKAAAAGTLQLAGMDGVGVIDDAIQVVFSVIKQIVKFFKKNDDPGISKEDGSNVDLLKDAPIEVKTSAEVIQENTRANTTPSKTENADESADNWEQARPNQNMLTAPSNDGASKSLNVPEVEKNRPFMATYGVPIAVTLAAFVFFSK